MRNWTQALSRGEKSDVEEVGKFQNKGAYFAGKEKLERDSFFILTYP